MAPTGGSGTPPEIDNTTLRQAEADSHGQRLGACGGTQRQINSIVPGGSTCPIRVVAAASSSQISQPLGMDSAEE
ncbi:hypothetical protein GCM10027444_13000 [Actinopolyspora lacussalsi]